MRKVSRMTLNISGLKNWKDGVAIKIDCGLNS